MKALHCYKPVERQSKIVHLLASMYTYEVLFEVSETTDSAAERTNDVTKSQPAKPVSLSTYTPMSAIFTVTTCLENLEMSESLTAVREMSEFC